MTECLTREPSTQNIKLTFKHFTIQLGYISIQWKFIHPSIFLSLCQNRLAKFIYFYTSNTLMTEKCTTIYSTANTCE